MRQLLGASAHHHLSRSWDLFWATEQVKLVLSGDDDNSYNGLNEILSKKLKAMTISNRLVECIALGSRHKLSINPKLDLQLCNSTIKVLNALEWWSTALYLGYNTSIILFKKWLGQLLGAGSILCLLLICQIVQSLVLCHLDYSSLVWSSLVLHRRRHYHLIYLDCLCQPLLVEVQLLSSLL